MSPIKLNGSSSGFVALDAPAAAGSNTLVLPTGNGSNGQVLTTNGSGTLSWSTITTGKILQVVSTTKTDIFSSSTTGAFTDITGYSVSITPSSASNKVFIMYCVQVGLSTNADNVAVRLVRDSTAISIGDASSSRTRATTATQTLYSNVNNTTRTIAGQFLDSPSSTSSTTYKLQFFAAAGTFYLNRNGEFIDTSSSTVGASTITVMEVAA